tara:strand:- start:3277 stop:3981 length:705 start_codon:yes stop_codon:yes gene_type:complete
MKIKALHFDVFGTVVDWRESIAREAEKILGREGFSCDWHAFADAWRSKYQPAMEEVRSGCRAWAKLDDLHLENLDGVLDEFCVPSLGDVDREHLNMAWHRLEPWPDVVAGMHRLRREYILATLSNGNVSLIVDMAKRAGLPWDAVLGAEVVRAYKPQPEAYLRNSEILNLKPSECLMVAAHNSDLISAGALGYRTAFVFRRTEHGPNQSIDLEPADEFDFIAEDFLDLAHKLGC